MSDLRIKNLPPCSGRTLIIGDIHGCVAELKTLIDAFSPGPGDRLIAVGDLINRGPDSAEVLELARAHGIEPILGNHEIRLLRAWERRDPNLLKPKDEHTWSQLKPADWEWISTWPHVLRIPSLNALAVHGGFAPRIPWERQDPGTVTRIQVLDRKGLPAKRSEAPSGRPWADTWEGPRHVYYGHTPRPHPLLHARATGLDTGCVYGYMLTAIALPDNDFYRVHAHRAYVGG